MRTIGLLTAGTGQFLPPAMAELGWIEGKNVRYEVRRVAADATNLDEVAANLARSKVDVLVGSGAPIVLALHRATRVIPIVCGGISDPVEEGLARSLRRPGMNVTGLSYGLAEAAVLQIGTLRTLLPGLRRLIFVAADFDVADRLAPSHENAARELGVSAEVVKVKDMAGVERLLASMRRPAAEAAWFAPLPRDTTASGVAQAALARRIASHGMGTAEVRAGMLMSYWLEHSELLKRLVALIDKVLRGMDPGAIPFEGPDKTYFALNRATAAALGLRIPPEILLRATEVIG